MESSPPFSVVVVLLVGSTAAAASPPPENNDTNHVNTLNRGEKISHNNEAGLVVDTVDGSEANGRAAETMMDALGARRSSRNVLSMSSAVNSLFGYTVVSRTLDHFKCSFTKVSARKNVASLLNVFEMDEPSGRRNIMRAMLLNSAFLFSASAEAAAAEASVLFFAVSRRSFFSCS